MTDPALLELLRSTDATIHEAVQRAVERAYETGYRSGLAATGASVAAPTLPPPVATKRPPPVAWDSMDSDDDDDAVDAASMDGDDAVDDDDADEGRSAGVLVKAARPNKSVGRLRQQIVEAFGLERYDVEIYVCRRGDRDRRQLKASAKLGLYERG